MHKLTKELENVMLVTGQMFQSVGNEMIVVPHAHQVALTSVIREQIMQIRHQVWPKTHAIVMKEVFGMEVYAQDAIQVVRYELDLQLINVQSEWTIQLKTRTAMNVNVLMVMYRT